MERFLAFFIVSWFVFAIFDISFDRNVFRAYTAKERSDFQAGDGLPRLRDNVVYEYRVRDDSVVRRTGDFVDEYDNCKVFDKENWACIFSDESGTFGAKQGEYFDESNLEKFPHLESYGKSETISRFGYILLKCRWDATGGIDVVMCLLRPFTT
jgi:hypothetical protein